MRYCPNCKKEVNTVLTPGQVVIMIFLLPLFPIFLLYCALHERKCVFCKTATMSVTSGETSIANDETFDINTYGKYVAVKKIMKNNKFVGYEFVGIKADQYKYTAVFYMDKNKAIEIKLDKNGCAKYYFDFEPDKENTLLYFADGRLHLKNS